MTDSNSRPLGQIVWHDLMTSDERAAQTFYGALFDWRIDDHGLIHTGGSHIGCIRPTRPGETSRWIPYVEVPDPDAMATHTATIGATITEPGTDIPGAGRFAELEDPQGAAVRLWKARPQDPTIAPAPGRVWWNQLVAHDPAAARDFYAAAIGWTPFEQDSPGADPYILFLSGEAAVGGVFPVPIPEHAEAKSHWQPFFWVEDCRAATAKAMALGGIQHQEPTIVPGAGTLSVIGDPTGADFLLMTPDQTPA